MNHSGDPLRAPRRTETQPRLVPALAQQHPFGLHRAQLVGRGFVQRRIWTPPRVVTDEGESATEVR